MGKRSELFWGTTAKENTARDYWVKALNHYKLLPGQTIEGECGTLSDRCYVIELKDKDDRTNRKTYNVGYSVAEELLSIAGMPKISPPFDLMKSASRGGGGIGGNGGGRGDEENFLSKLTPLNREFYQAINIVLIVWKIKEVNELFKECLSYLRNCPDKDTKPIFIFKFNKALGKDSQERTLQGMLSGVAKDFGEVRAFNFPLMNAILGKHSNLGEPANT